MNSRICRHCEQPDRVVCRPRGLCWVCYYTPGVRDMYHGKSGVTVRRGSGLDAVGVTPLPPEPTDAPVGSTRKVLILAERAAMGVSLWHPADNREVGELPEDAVSHQARR